MQDDWDSPGKPAGEITDQRVQPGDERSRVQRRVFTRWINVFLQRRDPPIQVLDLFEDIQDGRVLMALLEELSGCRLLYRFRSSSHRIFRLNNISKALTFLDDRHVKLLGIDASAISDGTPSVVLNLIWNIILHFQVKEVMGGLQRPLSSSLSSLSVSSDPSSDDLSPRADDPGSYCSNTLPSKGRRAAREPKYHGKALKSLLQWVQRRTAKYGIDVYDFGKSWRSGLAFLGLIKSVDPDLVDLRESLHKDPKENLQEAFRVAQRSLDIAALLEPEDVLNPSPDEKSIIAYVSMFLGLHSLRDEDHARNSEIPEIPNFGSPESVSLGETLADDPEAQAFLKGLEQSSEQLLWRRWSRKSGSTRPASLCPNGAETSDVFFRKTEQSVAGRPSGGAAPGPLIKKSGRSRSSLPSPLDATVSSPEIQSWMETDSGHGERRSHGNHVSLSSEEGIFTLPLLDSDEEDAFSYILDLNKEVFQPFNQPKRHVAKVVEETAEEMIEESKLPEARPTLNGGREGSPGRNGDPDRGSPVEAESEVHGKFNEDRKESRPREITRSRGELDPEPGAESGRKEPRQRGRSAGEQSNGDGGSGEEAQEKKMEKVGRVKDVCDETCNEAVKAEASEVACWQESVEVGDGERSERRGSERRAAWGGEREHLARSERVHDLGNIGKKSEAKENEQRMKSESREISGKISIKQIRISSRDGSRDEINSLKTAEDEAKTEETDRGETDCWPSGDGGVPDHRGAAARSRDVHREEETWTPASRPISGEGGFSPCDITPLELEALFVGWILLYCCLLLPQMNP